MKRYSKIFSFLRYDFQYFYTSFVKMLFKKIKYGMTLTDKAFTLKTLWIPLTYRCNLQCKMCGQWGDVGRSKNFEKELLQNELDLDILKSLIDDVKKYRPKVVLVGGEPFLYKNWYEIAEYIKKNNLRCEITTNGIKLQEVAEKCIGIFDAINISLDGGRKINDKIRGIEGGFDIVLEGIRKLNKVKKTKKPWINICCTIQEANYKDIEEIIWEIEKEDIKIDTLLFQHLEFVDDKILSSTRKIWKEKFNTDTNYWQGICKKTQDIDPEVLVDKINKVKKIKTKNIDFIMWEPDFTDEEIKNYYLSPFNIKRFYNICLAPYSEAFVYPDGIVWTCPGLEMGNIKYNKFTDIWNGKKYIFLRKILKELKTFPVCFRCANHWHNFSG